MWSVELNSPEETTALGRRIGEVVRAGDLIALNGDLGAGKTALSQGVGRGLGVTGPITSPTFVIICCYEMGRLPLYHADLYRLGDGSELQELGLDEMMLGDGVTLIEWASRFDEELPEDRLNVTIEHVGDWSRRLTAEATGPASRALLDRIRG